MVVWLYCTCGVIALSVVIALCVLNISLVVTFPWRIHYPCLWLVILSIFLSALKHQPIKVEDVKKHRFLGKKIRALFTVFLCVHELTYKKKHEVIQINHWQPWHNLQTTSNRRKVKKQLAAATRRLNKPSITSNATTWLRLQSQFFSLITHRGHVFTTTWAGQCNLRWWNEHGINLSLIAGSLVVVIYKKTI